MLRAVAYASRASPGCFCCGTIALSPVLLHVRCSPWFHQKAESSVVLRLESFVFGAYITVPSVPLAISVRNGTVVVARHKEYLTPMLVVFGDPTCRFKPERIKPNKNQ